MDSTLEDSMDVTMEQGDGSNANAPDSEPASASGVNKSRQQVKLFEYKTTRRNNRRGKKNHNLMKQVRISDGYFESECSIRFQSV